MALKDHYLIEDYPRVTDELESLHKTFMDVLESATVADFSTKQSQLQNINRSLTVLQELHKKKIHRDLYDPYGEYIGRWY